MQVWGQWSSYTNHPVINFLVAQLRMSLINACKEERKWINMEELWMHVWNRKQGTSCWEEAEDNSDPPLMLVVVGGGIWSAGIISLSRSLSITSSSSAFSFSFSFIPISSFQGLFVFNPIKKKKFVFHQLYVIFILYIRVDIDSFNVSKFGINYCFIIFHILMDFK